MRFRVLTVQAYFPFNGQLLPLTYEKSEESGIQEWPAAVVLMGIKRFDHKTKVKARSERQNLQTASQLCTKQVGTGEIN